ncbi:DUF1643 domain-containing protein [Frigidibacter sp. MR17.14]|uniref:DUF1643 domain-containing protein n=1 Tax=Frigidibacter sp. MR17.14 TaxID=3126509 RepID=UPI003012BD11
MIRAAVPDWQLRRHRGPGKPSRHRSFALWSRCGRYRYLLLRRWAPGPRLGFVMLNPSRATEARNDPTIARCEARARAAGYGGLVITNLFALCATDPARLKRARGPVGRWNDAALDRAAAAAALTICAWGLHGTHRGRDRAVLARLLARGAPLAALGLTRDGHPRHPLYLPAAAGPQPFPLAESSTSS